MRFKQSLLVISLLTGILVSLAWANQVEGKVEAKKRTNVQNPRPGWMIFLRFGSFQPASDIFKKVYGLGSVYGGELRFRIISGFYFSFETNYYEKAGKLTVTKEPTKITMTPLEAKVVYHFLPGKITPYIGAGIHKHYFRESNQLGKVTGEGLGYVICGGINARWRFLGLDARLKYASVEDKITEGKADFSGLIFDIALGFVLPPLNIK